MSNPLLQLLTQAGIQNPTSWGLMPGITLVGIPTEQGGTWVEDANRQMSRFVDLHDIHSIIEQTTPTFRVASGLRASPVPAPSVSGGPAPGPMCGSTDPDALDPYKPDGEIDDEILAEIIRQMAAEDPAVANAAFQALTNAWERAERETRIPEFSQKVDEASRRVQEERSVPTVVQQDQGHAPTAPRTHGETPRGQPATPPSTVSGSSSHGSTGVPFVASSDSQGVVIGGFGDSGILFTGTSIPVFSDGAPILSTAGFVSVGLSDPTVGQAPGAAVPVVHTAGFETDGAGFSDHAAPMLVTASGSPVPLAPFTVDVPLFPEPALEGTLRTASDDQYFTNLFGAQAAASAASPLMRLLVQPTPELHPLVEQLRPRVLQVLANYRSSLGLGANPTAADSPTVALSFGYDRRNEQIVIAVGPLGTHAVAALADASGEGGPTLPRRWPSHGFDTVRYFSHVSHSGDQDLSLPFGTVVACLPIHQYVGAARPLAPGLSGAMLTRRGGAATERATASVGRDTGSTDHQSGEGGREDGSGGRGGHSRGRGGRDQNEDEETRAA